MPPQLRKNLCKNSTQTHTHAQMPCSEFWLTGLPEWIKCARISRDKSYSLLLPLFGICSDKMVDFSLKITFSPSVSWTLETTTRWYGKLQLYIDLSGFVWSLCFHTKHTCSLNGLIYVKIMWIICYGLHKISTHPNTMILLSTTIFKTTNKPKGTSFERMLFIQLSCTQ